MRGHRGSLTPIRFGVIVLGHNLRVLVNHHRHLRRSGCVVVEEDDVAEVVDAFVLADEENPDALLPSRVVMMVLRTWT